MLALKEVHLKCYSLLRAAVAKELGCAFANAGDFIESSLVDGIHFSAASQRKLGESIAKVVTGQIRS